MSHALLIDRIRGTVASGQLYPMPDPEAFIPVRTMGDLTRPWRDFHPGYSSGRPEGGVFGYGRDGLARPRTFQPRPRRSRRPLPAPRRAVAAPKPMATGIFSSVAAIWQWYEANGKADGTLLLLPWDSDGLSAFVQPLADAVSDYHPLGYQLEEIGCSESAADLADGITLMLPHATYEDESSGVLEAFLSGPGSVHSILQHLYAETETRQDVDGSYDFNLPEKDRRLIEEVGFGALVDAYAKYEGEKTTDLLALSTFEQTYFNEVSELYPDQWEHEYPIVSGNGGWDANVTITCKDDIDFALAYAEAHTAMMAAMPDPYEIYENEEGACETFIHEVCEVWRKVNRKRAVKWESPKLSRLTSRYRRGDL